MIYIVQKRIFDIVLSFLGLLIFTPLMLITALLIKIEDHGPVFYRPIRTGRFGKPFRMTKFRTMIQGADRLGGPTTANNDPRVTKVGAWLRKYKIDELPQLFNVLMGQMSLVGPRPEVFEYTSLYRDEEKLILTVKPGITDFSSLEFRNLQTHVGEKDAELNFQEKILPKKNALRLKYVKQQSFSTDWQILLRTIRAVFLESQKG